MLGRLKGKTFNRLLSFLYQTFSESLSGKPRRPSIATSAGLQFPISSNISESVKTRLAPPICFVKLLRLLDFPVLLQGLFP